MEDRWVAQDKLTNSPAASIKNIVVLTPDMPYEFFQSFYLDSSNRKRIKPNVTVVTEPNMEILFETNSHGFKGPEIDFSKKLAVIWGDSVVFGLEKGWVDGISSYFPEYQFINGGIEGDGLDNICERAIEYNKKIEIKLNVLFPGWHMLFDTKKAFSFIEDFVAFVPNPVLCTIPTSLGDRIYCNNISHLFVTEKNSGVNEKLYSFWNDIPYSVEAATELITSLKAQNEMIRSVAKFHKLPLVDLYNYFYTDDLSSFRDKFFDAGHPRIEAFPELQHAFYEVLKNVI